MYIGLQAKYLLFLSDLMKTALSQQIFMKYSNVKFHEETSGGIRDVPC